MREKWSARSRGERNRNFYREHILHKAKPKQPHDTITEIKKKGTNNLVVPSSQLIKSTQPTLPISTIKQDIHWYESHYLRCRRKPQVPKFMALNGESLPICLLITKLPGKCLSLFVNLT